MALILALDFGGTKLATALVNLDSRKQRMQMLVLTWKFAIAHLLAAIRHKTCCDRCAAL
ncbi:MAG: hypothetical protein V7L01_17800 [Nostoc sp.]|uniref:hypothetical protein n=1 Tax=Nostoc sp. TaxID=1180 RepID=UPI002FF724A3